MRSMNWLLLGAGLLSGAAQARTEKPAIGPAPDWVKPVALPAKPDKSDEAAVRVLLADQQTRLEPGRITTYVDLALNIQTPQGLAAGNLSFPWNPEMDEITVHKLVIHRDGKDIDVLAGGQTFTVARREPNLEIATLDGMLTANIQPEGLQVGDVLEYALTVAHSDPVFQSHAEETGASWNGLPFARAHMSVQWPNSMPVTIRQAGALPALKAVRSGTMTGVDLTLDNVQPVLPPRLAPARYALGRVAEFSDFKSWADLGALMAPLYAGAAVIPAQGSLRDEVEKIKAASTDPVRRTEAALSLVQDRVRYVALLMGNGGYVPAKAEETWGRRYGDCKAKSALLLAVLRELGVDAEPVAANAISGDGIDQRLPMVGVFNHVLVRAHVGGKDYWLDGTRQGDTSLARLRVPDFGWGLPLVPKGAALVRMLPPALDKPDKNIEIAIDARGGLTLPAPIKVTTTLRGDSAVGTRLAMAQLTEAQRSQALREYWKGELDDVDVSTATATYNPETGEEVLLMDGVANMDWTDGWYSADRVGLGYEADFVREPGTDKDAPFANDYPGYLRTSETIQLPPGFPDDQFPGMAVDQTVAGTHYFRKASLAGNVFTIEATTRAIAPEFPASEAPAAQKALKAIVDQRASFRRPNTLRMTSGEIDAELKTMPTTADGFVRRAGLLASQNKPDEARAAFEGALKLDPANERAMVGILAAYASKSDLEGAGKVMAGIDIAKVKLPELAQMIGGLSMYRGDPKGAIAGYNRALELKPDQVPLLAARAQAYWATGNGDAALADIAATLKLDARQPDVRLLQVNILRARGKTGEAVAVAEDMVKSSPDDSYTHVVASRIFEGLGQGDRAMAEIDKAIALKPDATGYINRAYLRSKSDVAGRQTDIEAALKLDPAMIDAQLALASLALDKGDFAGAIKSYSALIDKRPDNVGLRNVRGIAYAKAGDQAHAEADFATARKGLVSASRLNNICYEKASAGVALDRALEECDAALKSEPDAAPTLDSKAFVLLRMGKLDDSIVFFDKALAKSPKMAASLYGRAIAWSKKGDKAKAQADRDAALAIDPNVERRFNDLGVKIEL